MRDHKTGVIVTRGGRQLFVACLVVVYYVLGGGGVYCVIALLREDCKASEMLLGD